MLQPIKSLVSLAAQIDRWRTMYAREYDPAETANGARNALLVLAETIKNGKKESGRDDAGGEDEG